MDVLVSGKNVDLGEALRSRIVDELTAHISRYDDRGEADVVVKREGHQFFVDGTIRLHSGTAIRIQGTGSDAHAALDAAIKKADTRLRRYRERLTDHHPAQKAAETARVVVLQPSLEDDGTPELEADEDDGTEFTGDPQPMIIAESTAPVRTFTVGMAVLELEVSNYPVLLFRNAAHGGLSVVYRRPDGNIGWIDPERTLPSGRVVAEAPRANGAAAPA